MNDGVLFTAILDSNGIGANTATPGRCSRSKVVERHDAVIDIVRQASELPGHPSRVAVSAANPTILES